MRIWLYLVLLLAIAGAVGCHGSKPKSAGSVNVGDTSSHGYYRYDEDRPPSGYVADTFYYQDAAGNMLAHWMDSVQLPDDKYAFAVVKQLAVYHSDEVDNKLAYDPWYGLFASDDGKQYLKAINISIKRVKDEIVDEGDEMTGKEVTSYIDDSCIALIGCLNTLKEGSVEAVAIGKKDSIRIVELDSDFTFQLKGQSFDLEIHRDRISVSRTDFVDINYKVYLVGEKNSKEIRQLIIAKSNPEGYAQLKWVGDMDGDGLPDLIIETACRDNVEHLTIYLSSFAKDGELVRMIGFDEMVGC